MAMMSREGMRGDAWLRGRVDGLVFGAQCTAFCQRFYAYKEMWTSATAAYCQFSTPYNSPFGTIQLAATRTTTLSRPRKTCFAKGQLVATCFLIASGTAAPLPTSTSITGFEWENDPDWVPRGGNFSVPKTHALGLSKWIAISAYRSDPLSAALSMQATIILKSKSLSTRTR